MLDEIITLICPIPGAPGKGEALREALLKLASATVRERGNLCYRPHATDDPDTFIVYEQWKNQAALDAHMAEPHLQAFLADPDHLLACAPRGQSVKELKVK